MLLAKAKKWKTEMSELRRIVLACGLTEEFKWYQPVYSFTGTNLIIIGAFKNYCTLSFFKGVLLKDPKKILQSPGPNSQSVRLVKFNTVAEILRLEPTLSEYIEEAIHAEKDGQQVVFKKITEHALPEELQVAFRSQPAFEKAFRALTPGRQRAYLLHFSSPKQSTTRSARIEKCRTRILDGRGLNERND